MFKIVLKVVLLAPLLSLLHSLDDILQVGVEDEAENLSLSCFRDLVLSRCDTTIKFIVKNSQISIILKYGVAGRLWRETGWLINLSKNSWTSPLTCWMLAEMVAITSIRVRLTIVRSWRREQFCSTLIMMIVIIVYLQRSLWLQRRRWGSPRLVESVVEGTPHRRGTQCSWNNPSLLPITNLCFPTFWRLFSLQPGSSLEYCQ